MNQMDHNKKKQDPTLYLWKSPQNKAKLRYYEKATRACPENEVKDATTIFNSLSILPQPKCYLTKASAPQVLLPLLSPSLSSLSFSSNHKHFGAKVAAKYFKGRENVAQNFMTSSDEK